jgi:hypothetical protein
MIDDASVHAPGMLENKSSGQNLELEDLERMLALWRECDVEILMEELTALLAGM